MEHKCSTCSTITYAGKIIMSSSDRLRQILNEHENSRPSLENNMSSFTYSRPISPTYHETTTTLQQSTENKIAVPRAYLLTDNNNTKSGKFTESHYASSSYYAGKNCLLSNYQYIGKYNEEIKKEVSKPFLKYL